jgi:hypothetical protein
MTKPPEALQELTSTAEALETESKDKENGEPAEAGLRAMRPVAPDPPESSKSPTVKLPPETKVKELPGIRSVSTSAWKGWLNNTLDTLTTRP